MQYFWANVSHIVSDFSFFVCQSNRASVWTLFKYSYCLPLAKHGQTQLFGNKKPEPKTQQIALELCLLCSPGRAFAKFSEPKKLWKYAVEQVCYFYFFLPFLFSTKVQQN